MRSKTYFFCGLRRPSKQNANSATTQKQQSLLDRISGLDAALGEQFFSHIDRYRLVIPRSWSLITNSLAFPLDLIEEFLSRVSNMVTVESNACRLFAI
jgi:hypothetical protein